MLYILSPVRQSKLIQKIRRSKKKARKRKYNFESIEILTLHDGIKVHCIVCHTATFIL